MADYIVVDGVRQFAPGVITKADASAVGGRGPVSRSVIGILYEASRGGEPGVAYSCSTANYLQQLLPPKEGYLFGKFAFRPSSHTERIPGGAERVYLARTNPATQASLTLQDAGANDAAIIKALDWGLYGNEITVEVAAGSSVGKKVTITYAGFDGSPEIIDNIGDYDVLSIAYAQTPGEVVDSMVATIDPAAIEGGNPILQVVYSFQRNGGVAAFNPSAWMAFDGTIKFAFAAPGAPKTITVKGTNKATGAATTEVLNIGGGDVDKTTTTAWSACTEIDISGMPVAAVTVSGNAFALDVGTYDEMAKIVDRVNLVGATPGFTAIPLTTTTSFAAADLDKLATQDILDLTKTFTANLWHFIDGLESEVVSCERAAGGLGLVADLAATALAGGANNNADTTSVQAALDCLKPLGVRHVVLLAKAAGTADAFAELLEAHIKERAGKWERVGYFGPTTYATKRTDPGVDPGGLYQRTARRNYRGMVFTPQEIKDYDHTGAAVWLEPYYTALLAAGCQAGRVNEASVIRAYVDVLDVRDYPGSTSANWSVDNHKEELLENACHILEKPPGSDLVRWVSDPTCHLSDNNPIYSSQVANESSDISIQNVRIQVEDLIGFTSAVVTTGRVKDTVDRELARQVEALEITAYERQSITAISGGNYFDVSYNFQPAEATKWIIQRAHIRRLQAA